MKLLLSILILLAALSACKEEKVDYVCPPCDLACDTLIFKKAGVCPHCKMELVRKADLIDESKLVLNEVKLETGSGVFLVEGGVKNEAHPIKVHYHKPENFTNETKILIVVPGAGRNGDSYRDAWVEKSEKYNVLILSPEFNEEMYPFEKYHLCGLVSGLNIMESVSFEENSNIAALNEEQLTYTINPNRDEWLFNDFDRIFELVVHSVGSTQPNYDLFGHSAGGQILHRHALFSGNTKANRVIASNSGFYTLPDLSTEIPFGIKNTTLSTDDLTLSFSKKLILLIGELDNAQESGGTLLRSKTVDKQGLHRLSRGKYFYQFSQKKAEELNAQFNWGIQVVPGVGHNHELMGDAAGRILYE